MRLNCQLTCPCSRSSERCRPRMAFSTASSRRGTHSTAPQAILASSIVPPDTFITAATLVSAKSHTLRSQPSRNRTQRWPKLQATDSSENLTVIECSHAANVAVRTNKEVLGRHRACAILAGDYHGCVKSNQVGAVSEGLTATQRLAPKMRARDSALRGVGVADIAAGPIAVRPRR